MKTNLKKNQRMKTVQLPFARLIDTDQTSLPIFLLASCSIVNHEIICAETAGESKIDQSFLVRYWQNGTTKHKATHP